VSRNKEETEDQAQKALFGKGTADGTASGPVKPSHHESWGLVGGEKDQKSAVENPGGRKMQRAGGSEEKYGKLVAQHQKEKNL